MAIFSQRLTGWVFARDAAVASISYVAGLLYLPRPMFLAILNGVLVAMCAAVCVIFSPSIVDFWKRGAHGVAIMRAAIAGAWADQLIQASARIYFIEFHPEITGRTFDASLGLPAVGYIIFAAMHIISIGMIDSNEIVRRNMCIVLWSAIAGVAWTLMVIGMHRAT